MGSTTEYVIDAYRSREEDAELITKAMDGDDEAFKNAEGYDDVYDYLAEAYALSVEVGFGQPLEITISTGGPGEWITATLDSEGGVESAEFWAVWGSDRRRTELSRTSALYRIAEYYAESAWEGRHGL